jgi:hypothetical protein
MSVFQIYDTPIIVLRIVKQRTEVLCVICSDSQGVTSSVICRYILSEISESLVENSPSFHLPSFITISGNSRHNSSKTRKRQQIVVVVLSSSFRNINRQYELVTSHVPTCWAFEIQVCGSFWMVTLPRLLCRKNWVCTQHQLNSRL